MRSRHLLHVRNTVHASKTAHQVRCSLRVHEAIKQVGGGYDWTVATRVGESDFVLIPCASLPNVPKRFRSGSSGSSYAVAPGLHDAIGQGYSHKAINSAHDLKGHCECTYAPTELHRRSLDLRVCRSWLAHSWPLSLLGRPLYEWRPASHHDVRIVVNCGTRPGEAGSGWASPE